MPRDLTTEEKLQEEIRCHRGMIASWEERGDATRMEKLVAEQRAIIDRATARIAELEDQFLQAPAMVAQYEQRLAKAREGLKLETNKGTVQKLAKATAAVQRMLDGLSDEDRAALLAAMAARDPTA